MIHLGRVANCSKLDEWTVDYSTPKYPQKLLYEHSVDNATFHIPKN